MASGNRKLTQEQADEIRILVKRDKFTYPEVVEFIKDKYDITIQKMIISDIMVGKTYIRRAKIAQRADGHRNEHAAKQAAEDDDKLGIKPPGYGLEF